MADFKSPKFKYDYPIKYKVSSKSYISFYSMENSSTTSNTL